MRALRQTGALNRVASMVMASTFAACSITAPATGQQALPQSLEVHLELTSGKYAATMQHTASAPNESIRIYATFINDGEKSVTLNWHFKQGAALPGSLIDTHSTSFHPTAVCARAGRSRVFYVAGWEERGARLVIEEWQVPQAALGVAEPMGGGPAQTLLSFAAGSSVRKTVVFSSSGTGGLGPVSSLACNPFGNRLLVLPVSEPKMIHVVDLDQGTVEPPLLLSAFGPGFEKTWALKSGKHLDRGLVISTREQATWVAGVPHLAGEPETELLVFEDSDLDGSIDFIDVLTPSAVPIAYPPDRWDPDFSH